MGEVEAPVHHHVPMNADLVRRVEQPRGGEEATPAVADDEEAVDRVAGAKELHHRVDVADVLVDREGARWGAPWLVPAPRWSQ